MKRKKTLESDAVNHGNKFAIRHTMANSSSKQQHSCSKSNIATHCTAAGRCIYISICKLV